MAISISLDRLLEYFRSRKGREADGIAFYLEAAASEAMELASVWQKVWERACDLASPQNAFEVAREEVLADRRRNLLSKTAGNRSYTFDPILGIVGRPPMGNIKFFSGLDNFYHDLTSVIGGKTDRDFHEQFLSHIASTMLRRNQAVQAKDEFLRRLNGALFVSDTDYEQELGDLGDLVQKLNEEAAALKTLAARYRASIP